MSVEVAGGMIHDANVRNASWQRACSRGRRGQSARRGLELRRILQTTIYDMIRRRNREIQYSCRQGSGSKPGRRSRIS